MTLYRQIRALFLMAWIVLVAACAGTMGAPQPPEPAEIAQLAAEIRAMGPGVSADEAARAAHVAYTHPLALAEAYGITDSPIVHNMKVNRGLRPRGLCWHWAEDMQTRLAVEGFRTLRLHRAIALPSNPFRLEHSTVIVSRAGDTMFEGIVLDPWRQGGTLFWTHTDEDPSYRWQPRREVLAERRARRRIAPEG